MGDIDKLSSFLGTGWAFPPMFSGEENSGVKMVSHEEDIRQSLQVLLTTNPGERIMLPKYGCGIRTFVYENIDETLLNYIVDIIRTSIINYETRIDVEDVEVIEENLQEGIIVFEISYTIRATNTRTNIVYPFYLNEGTNVTFL